MTNPSLVKRLEALESAQSPRAPIIIWEPYDPTRSQQAAFDARLEATKAAHPDRSIMIVGWEGAA
jgi:hypothetical protein